MERTVVRASHHPNAQVMRTCPEPPTSNRRRARGSLWLLRSNERRLTRSDENTAVRGNLNDQTLRGWCASGQCAEAVDGGNREWLLLGSAPQDEAGRILVLSDANSGHRESAGDLVLRPERVVIV